MQSKSKPAMTRAERLHVERVRSLPCAVCDAPAPSYAHHIAQRLNYCVVALCWDCHQGSDGWHGTKALWNVRKLDELGALNITLRRLAEAA